MGFFGGLFPTFGAALVALATVSPASAQSVQITSGGIGCRNLEGRTVALRESGFSYSQVMDADGSSWWVLAGSVRR